MEDAEKIIEKAKEEMREMLRSVYSYNSNFVKSKEQAKLLERILFVMSVIDRKFFCREDAYLDNALSIGEGQTISQPSTVARMLFLADLKERDDVLEVGTGSGWNASLIAFLVCPGNVVSVDRFLSLKEKASANLSELRDHIRQKKPQDFVKISRINFYAENIFFMEKAWKNKYDKIIITAGIEERQESKIRKLAEKLLKENGILICPHISGPILVYRKNKKLERFLTKEEYVFVPLLE